MEPLQYIDEIRIYDINKFRRKFGLAPIRFSKNENTFFLIQQSDSKNEMVFERVIASVRHKEDISAMILAYRDGLETVTDVLHLVERAINPAILEE
jgi:hypothetical protein